METELLDESFFQYDNDVPETRKKKPIIVGKLVSQVKKLKRTTSKVGHFNIECPCSTDELQSRLEGTIQVAQHRSNLLDKIRSHILTSDDERYISQDVVLKPKRYFKKRKAAAAENHLIYGNELKHAPLFRKQKCQRQRQNAKDIHASLLSIKHQMREFKVPADWTCIKENRIGGSESFLPSQLIRDVIQNINMHRLAIEEAMEKIKLKQNEIRQFSDDLNKLDYKLEQLIVKPDGNKRMIESVNQLKKTNPMLKQAFIRHKKIRRIIDADKNILNSTVRLKQLRAEVKAFNNSASFWSIMHWLFPLVIIVIVLYNNAHVLL